MSKLFRFGIRLGIPRLEKEEEEEGKRKRKTDMRGKKRTKEEGVRVSKRITRITRITLSTTHTTQHYTAKTRSAISSPLLLLCLLSSLPPSLFSPGDVGEDDDNEANVVDFSRWSGEVELQLDL